MKKSKKLFILIGEIILISILLGIIILNERESKVIDSIEIGKEESEKNEEPLNVVLANEEEQKNEVTEIEKNGTLEEDKTKTETEQKKTKEPTSIINTNIDKQASNDTSKIVSVTLNNKTTNPEVKQETENSNKTIEQPQETNQKTEQSKPVENKPVENKPVNITPVRTYKVNQTYINKLKNTIITEATNKLDKLNKYGITSVDQYKIYVDSSICTCFGGNRNGWTYENVSAYNTFKSSILKGTNIKIYAVDEYYNGEYIQTLCYYGH